MEEFLPSVVSNSPEWAEVIVADNGSTDDSIEMLKAKFPTVGIISFNQNYGFAEGYNQALKRLDHEYCVLLNSDVEVTPNWLDAPIATLDSDPSIACVQPKIRAQRNKEYFEYAVRPEDTLTNTAIHFVGENLAYRGKGRGAIRHSRRYLMGDRSLLIRSYGYV